MKTIVRLTLLSCLFFLLFMNGCKSPQTTTSHKNKIPLKPKLLFLTYKMSKTSEGNVQANLINKIVVEGKLKKVLNENKIDRLGTVQCIQTTKDLLPIQTENIQNPLIKIVEYIDDTGQLNKKQVVLDSTQFSIRMQLNSQSKFVILKYQKMTDGLTITLTKNEL